MLANFYKSVGFININASAAWLMIFSGSIMNDDFAMNNAITWGGGGGGYNPIVILKNKGVLENIALNKFQYHIKFWLFYSTVFLLGRHIEDFTW